MGGVDKGLLPAPSGERTLVERWQGMLARAGVRCVLVGRRAAYASNVSNTSSSFASVLDDAEPGRGPLGGLVALLEAAGPGVALALACDMPYVSEGLLSRLLDAPACAVLAPRRGGRWEPLCARYDAPIALPVARARLARGQLGLQGLLDELGARELALADDEARELDDWDTPEDRAARR